MEIIDFVNTTGENIGKIQNTKLATYLGVSERTIRYLSKTKPNQFNNLYLGSLCEANGITKESILALIKQNNTNI